MPEAETTTEETMTEAPAEQEKKDRGPRAALLAEVAKRRALAEKKPA